MAARNLKLAFVIPLIAGVALGGYFLLSGKTGTQGAEPRARIAAVEVAAIERRPLAFEKTFSGALEARAGFVVAPKVGGRIERVLVDLADPVERGQEVAFFDADEFAQAVKLAEAELAVAEAQLAQARNALEISRRENQRVVTLRERGIASEAETDVAQSDLMEKEAQFKVAEAQIDRAKAALESARIRYGYTRITADWPEADSPRMVAERFVDAGETVSANTPLLLIVQLDPIVAVISVTERDYGRLRPGLEARFETDAFPGEVFRGRIERIAPVFRVSSRQARIELSLANPQGRLKPGMFIRATITLQQIEDAVTVPESALTRRGNVDGIFLVDASGDTARWQPVQPGIRSQGLVQLLNSSLSGRVVTLGQHLIDDGSPIRIVEAAAPESMP